MLILFQLYWCWKSWKTATYLEEVTLLSLKSLGKTCFKGMNKFVSFMPTFSNIFCHFQHFVFNRTVLSILRHIHFTEASFKQQLPYQFFIHLRWIVHSKELTHFESWYLQRFNHHHWAHYRNVLETINL